MSSTARRERTVASASGPPRADRSAARSGPAATGRGRSTTASTGEVSSAPKIRSAPSAASPAPTPRPSLDAFISLYTTLHHLATLRAAEKAAEVSFTSSRNDLQHDLTALQAEVGEARARREVERQLGMLKELRDAPLEIVETLRDVAGAMEQSSGLLSSVECDAPDLRTTRDATYPLQLLLAECSTRLGRVDATDCPQLAALIPSVRALVDLRLRVLAETRFKLESDLIARRIQTLNAFNKLLPPS